MKTYYLRPGNALVRIDSDTKEIVNVLDVQQQKTISKLSSEEYYNTITSQVSGWTQSNETTFNTTYNEVLNSINNLL